MGQSINGGKGQDSLQGGNGKDIYTININEGVDFIDNYATDGMVDTLMLPINIDGIDINISKAIIFKLETKRTI